jgi:hypothetical protein
VFALTSARTPYSMMHMLEIQFALLCAFVGGSCELSGDPDDGIGDTERGSRETTADAG